MLRGMKNYTLYLFLLVLLGLALPLSAHASDTAPQAATLSLQEKHDIRRIELYLNKLKSVSADFLQMNDTGSMRHGRIAIKRPGKMRVTYDPPSEDFLVADGSFLHMWDGELAQQTSVPINEGIASLILRDHIELSNKDLIVTRFVRYPAKIEVDLVAKETPEEGELTLVFTDKPLRLRQWRVLDQQGSTTGINLENTQEDVDFPDGTFTFVSPKFGKSTRN